MSTESPHFVCVFGTRPEAIKMAPVVRALRAVPSIRTSVVTTGQHREMLDQVLNFFGIKPDVALDVMRHQQTLGDLTAGILRSLESAFARLNPSLVIVHGDTTTTFAGALAAFYSRVPVAHVEAGLRTHDLKAPWPEEANRRLTAILTTHHFAPTDEARRALLAEGHPADQIMVTGNTVVDALMDAVAMLDANPQLRRESVQRLPQIASGARCILVTAHRRENFDGGLGSLCDSLILLSKRPDVEVVFPIHLNPVVQGIVRQKLSGNARIHLLPPLDYPTFVTAMRMVDIILTDSGGIQEEAPSLGKPVLVLREATERPEAVAAGTVKMVGTEPDRIVREASLLLDDPAEYGRMAYAHNPYGDGHAAGRIVEALCHRFDMPPTPGGSTPRCGDG
jgi:UDP-N-acetylglucosamine 2-epimerase (non-hydrolysing)